MCRKAPQGSEREETLPHYMWCQPIKMDFRWKSILAKKRCARTQGCVLTQGRIWDKPNAESKPGRARWLAKREPKAMPHKTDLNYHKGVTLSPPVCLSTHTPNKHVTCFTPSWLPAFCFVYFIYFLVTLGLRCRKQAFSSCGEQGLLFVAVCGLLTAEASLVVEHRSRHTGTGCSTQAQ